MRGYRYIVWKDSDLARYALLSDDSSLLLMLNKYTTYNVRTTLLATRGEIYKLARGQLRGDCEDTDIPSGSILTRRDTAQTSDD